VTRTNMLPVVVVFAAGVRALAAEPSTQPALESAFADVLATSGDEYIAARDQLLAMDRQSVEAFLASKRQTTTEPIPSLLVEALVARLKNPERLSTALSEAFAFAAKDRSAMYHVPRKEPTPPEPNMGAAMLLNRLGDDAAPFATELLVKRLTAEWEPWQREVPVWTLYFLGRAPTRDGVSIELPDPRLGHVLLWVIEHGEDDACGIAAAKALRVHTSEELVTSLAAAAARAAPSGRKELLQKTVGLVEYDLRMLEQRRQRLGQPVTTSLPFRFTLDATRSLSDLERSEMTRLLGIASDSEKALERRREAVRLLGIYVGHRDCIAPLKNLVDDGSNPTELRRDAIVALSLIADKAVIPILIDYLGDPEFRMRLRAQGQLILLAPKAGTAYSTLRSAEDCAKAVAEWQRWWEASAETFVFDRTHVVLQAYSGR
jgi:hypothetical protein